MKSGTEKGVRLAGVAALASALVGGVVACRTEYQRGLDDVNYGQPNALAGEKQPRGPIATADGGLVDPDDDQSVILCVAAGGTLVDSGADCPVSFKDDVLEIFGRSGCAAGSSCHAGPTPQNQPVVEPSDGPGTWANFAGLRLTGVNGKMYINPCSTNKDESGIHCNKLATGFCGVHMPLGSQLSDADLKTIEDWVACGAPNN